MIGRKEGGVAARIVLATVVVLVAALTACSSRKQETINQREYAPYRGAGTARIAGQVSMTLASGQVLYGAACQVRLTPVTTESTRFMNDVVKAGSTKDWSNKPDSVWWFAQANDEGRFEFDEVPAGSYYVTCPVAWRDASGSAVQRTLWAETTVGPGERVQVLVSR
jgi:hypothetical protein